MAFKLAEAYVEIKQRGLAQTQTGVARLGKALVAIGAAHLALTLVKKALGGIVALGSAAIRASAEFEQTAISMEVLTGSARVAGKLLSQLREMGAKTPFEFKDLSKATETLLGFGRANHVVLEDVAMLSNIASGNANKLKSLALVYGQVAANGRLTGQDLLQMINVGFNPLQSIAEKTGETMAEVRDRMSEGAVSFEEFREAVKSATEEGGRFYRMNERQSETLLGRYSTFLDLLGEVTRNFGDVIANVFVMNEGLATANDLMEPLVEQTRQLAQASKLFSIWVGVGLGMLSERDAAGKFFKLFWEITTGKSSVFDPPEQRDPPSRPEVRQPRSLAAGYSERRSAVDNSSVLIGTREAQAVLASALIGDPRDKTRDEEIAKNTADASRLLNRMHDILRNGTQVVGRR